MNDISNIPEIKPPLPGKGDVRTLVSKLLEVKEMNKVAEALANGQNATIDGCWGSSASLVVATCASRIKHNILIVLSHPSDLDFWASEINTFSGMECKVFPADDDFQGKFSNKSETACARLRLALSLGIGNKPSLVLASIQSLLQPIPGREQLANSSLRVKNSLNLPPEDLTKWLVKHGYDPTEAVVQHGQFCKRGGIVDIYSPGSDLPLRIEFFGDEIESLRNFAPETQRSLDVVQSSEILAMTFEEKGAVPDGHLVDYLGTATVILVEPEEIHDQGRHYLERMGNVRGLFTIQGAMKTLASKPSLLVAAMPRHSAEISYSIKAESVERFTGEVSKVKSELDQAASKDDVVLVCATEAEANRLHEVLTTSEVAQQGRLSLDVGMVRKGFRLVGVKKDRHILVLGSQSLFRRDEVARVHPATRKLESRAIDSFLDLSPSDLVVHISHGIARYLGMELLEKKKNTISDSTSNGKMVVEEHLVLEFRDKVKVYVPVSKIDLVQKYVGGGKQEPELSKFGGTGWNSRKSKVQAAVIDLACEMIQMQAVRESQTGNAFPPDTEWQKEFEAAFPYQETPDQLASLAEIKTDLERSKPMDRLICGDVGYGKTELAIRAAFKTIDNGKQVAVLVPTTILAEQHLRTFSQRITGYPFVVECLNRFRSTSEQRKIIAGLQTGGIDIVVGTHRILSEDIKFKDLGLVIIDEEQRFGVEHKEKLKRMREKIDILTMTATPIPRTLHLSLLGIRDISNLETPPADRHAIETRIIRWDPELIRHGILREMNREGQVYFVHNRVHDIHKVADKLKRLVPEAEFAIVHGQMKEAELEEQMVRFLSRKADVLIATTIIESGLDIPNANTIFIDEADIYGLADLHQLRGRVGRQQRRAYAYMLLPTERVLSADSGRRLKAIEEFTELGAGFKIALRDLEIRGAGNILGTQQSGHIASVGYEMYCQLLENAVREMKNQPLRTPLEVNIDLDWPAFLPRDYVTGQKNRIEVYRRLARIRQLEKLTDFRTELKDRFGKIPPVSEWLIRLAEIRILAAKWQIGQIHIERPAAGIAGPTDLVMTYRNAKRAQTVANKSKGRLRVVDSEQIYCRLKPNEDKPERLYKLLHEQLQS
ncbi:MAG: transcription-repair coupling factor [Gemmataceae bacterium]